MTEKRQRRRSGGRAARQAARQATSATSQPFLTRSLAPVEIVSEEGLSLLEENANTILETVGIDFKEYPSALRLMADAGADVDGKRVRFPRGMCRKIVGESAPSVYTQHARNDARSVTVGGDATRHQQTNRDHCCHGRNTKNGDYIRDSHGSYLPRKNPRTCKSGWRNVSRTDYAYCCRKAAVCG